MIYTRVLSFTAGLLISTAAGAQTFPPYGQVIDWDGLGYGGSAWSAGNGISSTTPSERYEFVTGSNPSQASCDSTTSGVTGCLYVTIDLTPIEVQKTDQTTGALIWTRAQCTLTAADVAVSDGVNLGYPAPPWPLAFLTFGTDPYTGHEAYDISTGAATVKIQTPYAILQPSSAYGFYAVCVPKLSTTGN